MFSCILREVRRGRRFYMLNVSLINKKTSHEDVEEAEVEGKKNISKKHQHESISKCFQVMHCTKQRTLK